jgi:hypothetical protein
LGVRAWLRRFMGLLFFQGYVSRLMVGLRGSRLVFLPVVAGRRKGLCIFSEIERLQDCR